MVVAKHRTHTRNPAARPAGRRAGRRIGSVLQLQPDQGGRRTFSRASGATFARLDAYEIQAAIVAHPENYGLTNATTACITPSVAPYSCQNADDYLFWDGIHPTKAGHAILAAEAANAVR